MKTTKPDVNNVDYGIYIDRKVCFVIGLDHSFHEAFLLSETNVNEGALPRSTKVDRQQEHLQNDKNEQLKKFCKSIIERLVNAHSLLIFGPAESKYELQKEIRNTKSLKNVPEELETTDAMDRGGAERFVREYYG